MGKRIFLDYETIREFDLFVILITAYYNCDRFTFPVGKCVANKTKPPVAAVIQYTQISIDASIALRSNLPTRF